MKFRTTYELIYYRFVNLKPRVNRLDNYTLFNYLYTLMKIDFIRWKERLHARALLVFPKTDEELNRGSNDIRRECTATYS